MNDQDILQQFESINTWKSKGERAPHKPLLMLLALGVIQRGNTGFIPYATIKPKLKELLKDFGPPRKEVHSRFPFIRLANDQLWQFNKPEIIRKESTPSIPLSLCPYFFINVKKFISLSSFIGGTTF